MPFVAVPYFPPISRYFPEENVLPVVTALSYATRRVQHHNPRLSCHDPRRGKQKLPTVPNFPKSLYTLELTIIIRSLSPNFPEFPVQLITQDIVSRRERTF